MNDPIKFEDAEPGEHNAMTEDGPPEDNETCNRSPVADMGEVKAVDAETTIPQGIRNITPGQFMAMLNRAIARDKQRNKNRAKNKVARAQRNLNRRNNKGNH